MTIIVAHNSDERNGRMIQKQAVIRMPMNSTASVVRVNSDELFWVIIQFVFEPDSDLWFQRRPAGRGAGLGRDGIEGIGRGDGLATGGGDAIGCVGRKSSSGRSPVGGGTTMTSSLS
jgi:hypothetical protein